MSAVRIGFTGGGSGGHVYPLVAVAEAIQKLAYQSGSFVELYYFGPNDGFGAIVQNAGMRMRPIASSKVRRYAAIQNIIDIPKFVFSVFQALWKVFWVMPDVLFSKGGPGALPVIFAAWVYRIPVVIHESDANPGVTTLLSARFAKKVAISFERCAKFFDPSKVVLTGNPLRQQLLGGRLDQDTAKTRLEFDANKPLLLILGGSQGSQRINEFIVTVLKELVQFTQVLHQTGQATYLDTVKLSQASLLEAPPDHLRYKATAYLDDNLSLALTAADFVLARAGSGTIFELSAYGKPVVLVPLQESANDHQRANAYEFAKTGAAIVIEEPNLLPGIFVNQIRDLIQNRAQLMKMGEASSKFFNPQASDLIAKELADLI